MELNNAMLRVLIGTIGYHNLRDYSVGPKLLPLLKTITWPNGIEIEEMNWNPIAIVQKFQTLKEPYHRVVFLTARACGRPPGTISLRKWNGGVLPDENNIQQRIAEAVTGVINIDNLLIIGEYFKIWPEEVAIIDVEPGEEEMGDTFTPPVKKVIPLVLEMVKKATLEEWSNLSFTNYVIDSQQTINKV